MKQPLALPDMHSCQVTVRAGRGGGGGGVLEELRAESQSSRSGVSAQRVEPVRWWTGSPSEGRGLAALDRAQGCKETLNPTGAPVRKPVMELRASAKDKAEAKQRQHPEMPALLQSPGTAGQGAAGPEA